MRKLLLLTALAVLCASFCAAQEKPNFTGKWKLEVDKSDFGPFPGPDSRTDVIEHNEPKLKVTSTTKSERGERTTERNYTTDGEENVNKQGDNEIKSRTRWDGKALVTESKAQFQGNDVEIKDRWEMDADSKVLTIQREFKSAMGEATQKLVFSKTE